MTFGNLVSLREIGYWNGGSTPSKGNLSYWTNGSVPWVSPKDMKVWEIVSSEDQINQAVLDEGLLSLVPADSLLIVTRSGILSHTLPVAITKLPVTINQDLKALILKNGISAKYIAYALRAFNRQILAECSKQGTTVSSIETSKLLEFKIPLAALEYQNRLVTKLEELLSDLDAGIAALERTKANLKRYRASVLKAAIEGKLTAEWRRENAELRSKNAEGGSKNAENNSSFLLPPSSPPSSFLLQPSSFPQETGAELLARILKERRAKWEENQLKKFAEQGKTPPKNWQDKYQEPCEPHSNTLSALPEGWVWATIGQLCLLDSGEAFKKQDYCAKGVRLLQIANVSFGKTEWEQQNFVPEEFLEKYKSIVLQAGDFVLALNRPILSGQLKVAIVSEADLPAILYQRVGRLRPVNINLSPYLFCVLQSEIVIKAVRERLQGTDQPYLNTSLVPEIPIPLISQAEQKEITAEVERRLSIADATEKTIAHALTRAARLRQAILKRAFEGRLVPQDPYDEPASELLKRIQAERATQAPAPGRKPRKARAPKAEPA